MIHKRDYELLFLIFDMQTLKTNSENEINFLKLNILDLYVP